VNKLNAGWKTEVMQHIMTFKTCPNWSISHLTGPAVHNVNSAYLQNLMHAFTIFSFVVHHQTFFSLFTMVIQKNTIVCAL
jgi:hypothetical protein